MFRVIAIIVIVSTGMSLIATILMLMRAMPFPENPTSPMAALQVAYPWLDILQSVSTIGLFTIFLSPRRTEIFFGRVTAQTRAERTAMIVAGVMAIVMAVTGLFFVGAIIKSGVGGFWHYLSALFSLYILWLGCRNIFAEQLPAAKKEKK